MGGKEAMRDPQTQDPFAIWTKTTPIAPLACEGSSSVSRDTARVSIGETCPHSGPIGPTLWYAPAPLLLCVCAVGYSARWVPSRTPTLPVVARRVQGGERFLYGGETRAEK